MAYSDAYDPLDGIAIIGMAGRFPESPNVAALWQNLLASSGQVSRWPTPMPDAKHHKPVDSIRSHRRAGDERETMKHG
jgi:acyl transferase domain-containing protein